MCDGMDCDCGSCDCGDCDCGDCDCDCDCNCKESCLRCQKCVTETCCDTLCGFCTCDKCCSCCNPGETGTCWDKICSWSCFYILTEDCCDSNTSSSSSGERRRRRRRKNQGEEYEVPEVANGVIQTQPGYSSAPLQAVASAPTPLPGNPQEVAFLSPPASDAPPTYDEAITLQPAPMVPVLAPPPSKAEVKSANALVTSADA